MSDYTSHASDYQTGEAWAALPWSRLCYSQVRELAVADTLEAEMLWQRAAGVVVIALWGCLPLLDRKWPRDLGKLAVCVVLSPALLVVGGGGTCHCWLRLCYGGGIWGMYC